MKKEKTALHPGYAWRWRWIMTGTLVLLPALAFAWWGRAAYPETFPTLIEELDRKAWLHGAPALFPDRFQQFHDSVLKLRSRWRMETNHWWSNGDAEHFNTIYQGLVEEGSLLLEASRQKSIALRQEVEELLEPEQAQLTRLRNLSPSFNMENDMPALSKAEGLLRESMLRLQQGQFLQARSTGEQALRLLHQVEIHTMAQMERYTSEGQLILWEQWVNHTIRWSTTTSGTAVIVLKAPRRLFVYQHGRIIADYPVRLGFSGLTDKLYEGDGATPEGQFHVIRKKEGTGTKYYKALLLDYPTKAHRQRFQKAQANGEVPLHRSIGSLIEIHGDNLDREDTTSGCIGLENAAIDEVFERAKTGTPVTIVGAVSSDNQVADTLHLLKEHIQQRKERWHRTGALEASLIMTP